MPAKASLLLEFGSDTCPGALFEMPEQAVDPGELMTLRIWAATEAMLDGYELRQGLQSLGLGSRVDYPGQVTCKYFDWAGENTAQQFDFPVSRITRVTAFSPLQCVVGDELVTVAPQGQDVTDKFVRLGHSCLAPILGLFPGPLYGTTHAVAERPPYAREWAWTAPTDPTGAQWFFLYRGDQLKRRFSLALSDELEDASIKYVDCKIRVIDADTAGAVLGAQVYIEIGEDYVDLGLTDSRYGFVKVFNVLSGEYFVAVGKTGYATWTGTITIKPDGDEVRVRIEVAA
ncbi:MAG: hypothetical protein RDU30_09900 [Desulfovibrionaceae bacterium]|nr:hypothetical protein [Desulfovibrionaceae bacterium]